MRSDLVVLPEPSIDNDLGLFGGEAVYSTSRYIWNYRNFNFFSNCVEKISVK